MNSLIGKAFLFISITLSLCFASEKQARVVGGSNAQTLVSNYMVAFIWKTMRNNPSLGYFCSGSLIDEEYVLSSASCFDNPATNQVDVNANSVLAIVGTPNLNGTIQGNKIIDIRTISIHNEWGPSTGPLSNVAVIRLDNNVPNGLTPIPLARPADDAYFTTSGNVVVSGWGVNTADSSTGIYSTYLQQATIPIVPNNVCQTQSPRFNLTDRYMCAGTATPTAATACIGDEGAPIVVMYNYAGTVYPVQVGIMTTVSSVSQPKCNGRYGIYTKVSNAVNFNYVTARGVPVLFYPSPSLSTTSFVTSGLSANTGIEATTGLNATVNSASYLSLSVLALLSCILLM